MTAGRLAEKRAAYREAGMEGPPAKKEIGLTKCNCELPFVPGTVLDPFSGAGTTAVVSQKLGRNFVAIELNGEYISMSKKRQHAEFGLFNLNPVS